MRSRRQRHIAALIRATDKDVSACVVDAVQVGTIVTDLAEIFLEAQAEGKTLPETTLRQGAAVILRARERLASLRQQFRLE